MNICKCWYNVDTSEGCISQVPVELLKEVIDNNGVYAEGNFDKYTTGGIISNQKCQYCYGISVNGGNVKPKVVDEKTIKAFEKYRPPEVRIGKFTEAGHPYYFKTLIEILGFMRLEKLPSIIQETEFDEKGFAKTDAGLLVPAYVASQLGFSASGKEQLDRFYGRLRDEAGILALCPFKACGEYLDFSRLGNLNTIEEVLGFCDDFNNIVGLVNYEELMPRSKLMIAVLDGGHALDDGVSGEIGFYAAEYKGEKPIVGIRSDFRLAENPAAPINPAVRYFIDQGPYNGSFFSGFDAYDKSVESIAKIAEGIKNS